MAIVFIPGIKATELIDTQAPGQPLCWPLPSPPEGSSDHMNALLADLTGDATAPRRIIPGNVLPDIAASMLTQLRQSMPKEHVHAFGYDWRQSLKQSAQQLIQWMKRTCQKEKSQGHETTFHFVTHSMGGLVLRAALGLLQGHPLRDRIRRIVCIAPPFHGSLGATYALVIGENEGTDNAPVRLPELARAFPSVYQLLPTWSDAVIDQGSHPVNLFDTATWPSFATKEAHVAYFLNQSGLSSGPHNTAATFDSDEVWQGIKSNMLIIAGTGTMTACQLPIKTNTPPAANIFDFARMKMSPEGDGHVLLTSAAIKGICLAVFDTITSHAEICNDIRIQQLVCQWLKQTEEKSVSKTASRPKHCTLSSWNGKIASFSSHMT